MLLQQVAYWLSSRPRFGRCALRLVPDIEYTVRIDPIGRFRIRLMRNRSYWLRHPLTHERFLLGALRSMIRPGDVVYDVGANVGLYSRFMAGCFAAGRVFAFEPMTDNLHLLRANLALGACAGKVRVLPLALADREAEEELQVDDVMSATACLSRVTNGAACEGRRKYGLAPVTERVQVARLDWVLDSEKLAPPQVIKVDIEGAEALFLRGACATLCRYRPRLAIELHGLDKTEEVLCLLAEHRYHCFGWLKITGEKAYRQVHAEDVAKLEDYHDLQYVVASQDRADVATPFVPYIPIRTAACR